MTRGKSEFDVVVAFVVGVVVGVVVFKEYPHRSIMMKLNKNK